MSVTHINNTESPFNRGNAVAARTVTPESALRELMPACIESSLLPVQIVDHDGASRTRRQQEFNAGRKLTSQLLARLGRHEPVGVNHDRSPAWPDGVTGSISHSENWLWSAVATGDCCLSIGIDTEPVVDSQTQTQLVGEIATDCEWQIVKATGLTPLQQFTVLFSAKESFYKCWYPLHRRFLGFAEAKVVHADQKRITVQLNSTVEKSAPPESLDVVYAVHDGNVFTATWIEVKKS